MLVKSLKKVDVCHSQVAVPPIVSNSTLIAVTPYWLGFSPESRE